MPGACAREKLLQKDPITLRRWLKMSAYILEMKNITKTFPGVIALNNVSLQVKRGEISDGKTAIAALQAEHILAGE